MEECDNAEVSINLDVAANDSLISMDLHDISHVLDIEKCLKLAKQASISMPGNEWNMKEGNTPEKPPSEIKDKFSAVLGSGFHAAHCIITPMKHE